MLVKNDASKQNECFQSFELSNVLCNNEKFIEIYSIFLRNFKITYQNLSKEISSYGKSRIMCPKLCSSMIYVIVTFNFSWIVCHTSSTSNVMHIISFKSFNLCRFILLIIFSHDNDKMTNLQSVNPTICHNSIHLKIMRCIIFKVIFSVFVNVNVS